METTYQTTTTTTVQRGGKIQCNVFQRLVNAIV